MALYPVSPPPIPTTGIITTGSTYPAGTYTIAPNAGTTLSGSWSHSNVYTTAGEAVKAYSPMVINPLEDGDEVQGIITEIRKLEEKINKRSAYGPKKDELLKALLHARYMLIGALNDGWVDTAKQQSEDQCAEEQKASQLSAQVIAKQYQQAVQLQQAQLGTPLSGTVGSTSSVKGLSALLKKVWDTPTT